MPDFLSFFARLATLPTGGETMGLIDNCDSCGAEVLASELVPIKLGSQMFENLKICVECSKCSDPEVNFEEAAELVAMTNFMKGSGGV